MVSGTELILGFCGPRRYGPNVRYRICHCIRFRYLNIMSIDVALVVLASHLLISIALMITMTMQACIATLVECNLESFHDKSRQEMEQYLVHLQEFAVTW